MIALAASIGGNYLVLKASIHMLVIIVMILGEFADRKVLNATRNVFLQHVQRYQHEPELQ